MGLLALAGMVSGAGEGLTKAASQVMSIYGSSLLQKERDAMELRRLQLMEDNANARELRSQEFQRGLQQERIGADLANRSLDRQYADDSLSKTQGFTASENDKTRGQHREDQAQALQIAKATLTQGDQRLASDRMHQDATVRIAQAQLDAAKAEATLMPMADGSLARVNGQGEVIGRAIDPETGKPLQGTKDLSATTKLLVDVNKTMIQLKGEQLKNPSLLPEERSAINRELNKLQQDTEMLLGRESEKKGPIQITDPAATRLGGSDSTIAKPPPESRPAPDAEEYLAQMRQQFVQREAALKAATQQAGQAAMDADKPDMAVATTPLFEQPAQAPAPRSIATMERHATRRMQTPGEVNAPTGTGLIAAASKPDPLVALTSNAPPVLPRELPRATAPKGMMEATKEPAILDPDGILAAEEGMEPAVTDFEGIQASRDADTLDTEGKIQPTSRKSGRPISSDNLRTLLTRDQKRAIIDMRERIVKPGITEKPATPGQLQDLLLKILGPLYRDNGQGPGDLADGVIHMMDTLLPESAARK